MQSDFAIIAGGLVENIAVIDSTDALTIASLGAVAIPSGTPVTMGWTWDGTIFAPPVPTLDEAKAVQSFLIRTACQSQIISGFSSAALGTPYSYPSNLVDQQNLSANVLSSTLPSASVSGWTTEQLCADGSTPPVWAYRAHTQAQIQQVGLDAKAAIMACLLKNATLQSQIAAATTVAGVQAVVW